MSPNYVLMSDLSGHRFNYSFFWPVSKLLPRTASSLPKVFYAFGDISLIHVAFHFMIYFFTSLDPTMQNFVRSDNLNGVVSYDKCI